MSTHAPTHNPAMYATAHEIHVEGDFCRIAYGEVIRREGVEDHIIWHVSVMLPKAFALQHAEEIKKTCFKASPLKLIQ